MCFKRIFPVLAGLLLLCTAALGAGDSASFVDLGFSPDGSIYMFAQYGVRSGTLRPWADMFVVDVTRNDFVRGGRLSYTHSNPIQAGQNGSGALFHLVAQNAALAARHEVIFPNQGLPLYIALDGDPAYNGEDITFRDFVSGISYKASLVETITGEGLNLRSSFFITVESTESDGSVKTFTVGTPELRRSQIMSYRIKKVLIAPSGNSLIFVIEMKRRAETSHDIRYMVEALRF